MKFKTFDLVFLNECFIPDFISGNLIWKIRPKEHFATDNAWSVWNSKFSGKVAGHIDKSTQSDTLKYKKITMTAIGCCYIHRILYAMYHEDSMPPVIDHFDGNGINNSISNLMPSSNKNNSRNSKMNKRNKTGILGICWVKSNNCWECKIGSESTTNKSEYRRLLFKDFFEACCQRKSWENQFNYAKRHGSN